MSLWAEVGTLPPRAKLRVPLSAGCHGARPTRTAEDQEIFIVELRLRMRSVCAPSRRSWFVRSCRWRP